MTKKKYYTFYSIAFLITSCLVFSWFYYNGKSFVQSEADGLKQHYIALSYLGKYLREVARNILQGNFIIKQFDFNLGFGADVLTTLNYYVIGDPLTLFSVLVPLKYTEILYAGLILLRCYLAGVAFSMYCNKMEKKGVSVIVGSLVYVFCGYTLYAAVRHPYFINPMIYFPLILIGIEKIFRKERPYLFILMTTLCAISNFYFFYMISILMVLYAIVRFFYYYKENYLKNIGREFIKFTFFYGIGILISAIIFLPVVYSFFQCGRTETGYSIGLFYQKSYYLKFLSGFISPHALTKYWTCLGYNVIVIFSIIALFMQRKHRSLKIGFLLLTFMLMFPFFGRAMNGFGYASNRWIWAYSMLLGYIVVVMLPSLLSMGKKVQNVCALTCLGYLIYTLSFSRVRTEDAIVGVVMLLSFYILLLLLHESKYSYLAVISFCIFNSTVNAGYRYSYNEANYIKGFVDEEEAIENVLYSSASSLLKVKDDSFYRFDEDLNNHSILINSEAILRLNRVGYYYSVAKMRIL